MKFIEPPFILNKGIAVFVPPKGTKDRSNVAINIFYSKSHPHLSWLDCNNTQSLIWSKQAVQSEVGILFIYESILSLEPGFYTIKLLAYKDKNSEGQITIGILQTQDNIIVGTPYSSYPPIELS